MTTLFFGNETLAWYEHLEKAVCMDFVRLLVVKMDYSGKE